MAQIGRDLWGIEVKASRMVSPAALSGLRSFAERERRCVRRIVVFLGSRKQTLDTVEVLPLEEFLAELPS
ncbi:MAG: hypothetical protein U1E76_27030 [Planctomycetota bacterium]